MIDALIVFAVGIVTGIVIEKLDQHESKEFKKFQDRWNACKMGYFDYEKSDDK